MQIKNSCNGKGNFNLNVNITIWYGALQIITKIDQSNLGWYKIIVLALQKIHSIL